MFDFIQRLQTERARAAVATGLTALTGCSSLAEGDDSLDDRWGCLDSPVAPARTPAADSVAPARVSVTFIDLFQREPLSDLRIRACLGLDPTCESPVLESAATDDAGRVDLPLFVGFDGFLEIVHPDLFSTLYFLPVLERDLELSGVGLVPRANLETFNANFNAGIDFEKRHLVVTLHDCQGTPAEGVHLVTQASAKRFFMIGGLPSFVAGESGPGGAGGLLNLDASSVFVDAEVEDEEGQRWSIGRGTYALRAGWATIGRLGPRFPSP